MDRVLRYEDQISRLNPLDFITDTEAALTLYFGRPIDDDLRRRATAMTTASLLRETMWSMVSEIHSTVDFDYAAYTSENLRRFEAAWALFEAMEKA